MKKFLLISLMVANCAIQAADNTPVKPTADKPVAAATTKIRKRGLLGMAGSWTGIGQSAPEEDEKTTTKTTRKRGIIGMVGSWVGADKPAVEVVKPTNNKGLAMRTATLIDSLHKKPATTEATPVAAPEPSQATPKKNHKRGPLGVVGSWTGIGQSASDVDETTTTKTTHKRGIVGTVGSWTGIGQSTSEVNEPEITNKPRNHGIIGAIGGYQQSRREARENARMAKEDTPAPAAAPVSEAAPVTKESTTDTTVIEPAILNNFAGLVKLVEEYKSNEVTPANKARLLKIILAYVGDKVETVKLDGAMPRTIEIQGQGTISKKNIIEIEFLISALFNEDTQSIASTSLDDKISNLQWALEELSKAVSHELSMLNPVVAKDAVLTPVEKTWKKWAWRTGGVATATAVTLFALSLDLV